MGGAAKAIKLTRAERQIALGAAKAMNLDVAGVDLLQSERGPLVMEVNAFPMFAGIESVTGNDVATLMSEKIGMYGNLGYGMLEVEDVGDDAEYLSYELGLVFVPTSVFNMTLGYKSQFIDREMSSEGRASRSVVRRSQQP